MFCTQCGKKIKENILFCPYCGSPVLSLEELEEDTSNTNEELRAAYGRPEAAADIVSEKTSQSISNEDDKDESVAVDEFVPLEAMYSQNTVEEELPSLFDDSSEEVNSAPVRLQGHMPSLNRERDEKPTASGKSDTLIPKKRELSVDELFMDQDSDDDEEEAQIVRKTKKKKASKSFLDKHLRGIVSLILTVVLICIVLIWSISPSGQRTLARFGASQSPGVYAQLAKEAYDRALYAEAASWYEKAFDNCDNNADCYSYAYSAGVCFYEAQNPSKAEMYFRKAIELKPDDANAYGYIRALYVNVKVLPEGVAELLRSGYERTHDERLRID